MTDFSRILSATSPLTLASVTRGSQPLVMADLARAAKGRAVFVADNEASMSALAEAARFFAPELQVIEFPSWDCLPYDRASPALSVSARRLAALHQLQAKRTGPQLLVTTTNALTQRVLTPFRIRESVKLLKPGLEIGHESLIALLRRQGYQRTDTAIDAGEFAVRGSIFDIVPSGLDAGLRLDFFGDELETLRLFDTNTQRSTGTVKEHLLVPASEALIDEASVKRFRTRYRELFGANATADPLYQAVSDGRRLAGMEHWLPLFEDRLVTLFDHLAPEDVMVLDSTVAGASEERFGDIADYFKNRKETSGQKAGSYRPLATDALYLAPEELAGLTEAQPAHKADPFAQPESARVLDFGFSTPAISRPNARAATTPTRPPPNTLPRSASRAANPSSPPIRRAAARASSRSWARLRALSRALPRPGRRPWAWRSRAAPRRWFSRSRPALPTRRSRSSPSRISWVTASSGARSARRTPTPSWPSSPR
ncbi:hypothetical protein MBENS4_3293 [Novosphingobium sp. MBES04]|nr:hypothetical protein MBENS4_3293 [Novosphingobium sp. MBES04]